MNAQIRNLKADIAADLESIAEIYQALHRSGNDLVSEDQRIVVTYYLHNLYFGLLRNLTGVWQISGLQPSGCHIWRPSRLKPALQAPDVGVAKVQKLDYSALFAAK